MSARAMILLAAALALLVLAAGCGGDDEGDSAGTTAGAGAEVEGEGSSTGAEGGGASGASLSKVDYIERATAICNEAKAGLLDQVSEYVTENPSAAGESPEESSLRTFAAVQLPLIESELAMLRELGVPEEGAAPVESFYATEQRAIESAADLNGPESAEAMQKRFSAAARQARLAGIPACANAALITG